MHYTARPHQGIAQRVLDEEPDAACATPTDIDRQQTVETRSWRLDQRAHACRMTPENLQVAYPIQFSNGTGLHDPDGASAEDPRCNSVLDSQLNTRCGENCKRPEKYEVPGVEGNQSLSRLACQCHIGTYGRDCQIFHHAKCF